ncbi:MAG TPA: hypothetical protein P5533_07115 [Candidatus Cloacimonadota bacterium]|nr:hypothetical protein [Candidatus Cloacimonadota bacterium]
MKTKTIILIIVTAMLLVGIVAALSAQTLPVDSRKKEMQFHRSFECLRYAAAADTTWRRITIPDGTVEVQILPVTGAIGVRPDSLYTNNKFVDIAAGVPLKLPVYRTTKIYVRRTAAGTASVANVLFLKM